MGVVLGLLASRSLLARLRTVGAAARSIAAGNMLARVPTRGRDDEFDDLGRSINLMLERIEELMRRVRQISSDIAHDLRAPLSLLKQNIPRMRNPEPNHPAKLRMRWIRPGEQVDAILNTFEALLKIGADRGRPCLGRRLGRSVVGDRHGGRGLCAGGAGSGSAADRRYRAGHRHRR